MTLKETYIFLVDQHRAAGLFQDHEFKGPIVGKSRRKVLIAGDDPRLAKIQELQAESVRLGDEPFVIGGRCHRSYSRQELESADLFLLHVTAEVPNSGESYGTVYNRTGSCPVCGAGEQQVSDLILDLRKVPKSADIAATLSGEWLVSQRLAEIMVDANLTGLELQRVYHKVRHDEDPIDLRRYPSGRELLRRAEEEGYSHPSGLFWLWLNRPEQNELVEMVREEHFHAAKVKDIKRPGKPPPIWHQLRPTSTLQLHGQTKFGINPFNDDPEGEYRCPLGHARGLRLLSEAFVSRHSWDGSDFAVSSDWVGAPATPLVPRARYRRLLFISPRVWRLLREHKIKGWKVEIARLV